MITSNNAQEQIQDNTDEHTKHKSTNSKNVPSLLSLAKIWVYILVEMHLVIIYKFKYLIYVWMFKNTFLSFYFILFIYLYKFYKIFIIKNS